MHTAPQPAPSRAATLAAKLGLVLAGTCAAVLLFEAGLRLVFYAKGVGRSDVAELLRLSAAAPAATVDTGSVFGIVQPSPYPDVVYELRPNLSGKFRGQEFATNSFGLRGPEVARAKPPGTFRIVGLGDSHMFGWGVAQDETYLALLERRLRDAGHAFELLNFAGPGYNTAIEVAVYERKARHFAPDLVLMHFVGNDLSLPHHLQPPRTWQPSDWFLVELLRGAFGRHGLDGELELLPHNLKELPDDVRAGAHARYAYMLGEDGYRAAMGRLATLTKAAGVPVLVMSLGERGLVGEVAAEHGFDSVDPAEVFLETLAAAGLATTRESWRANFRIANDGHPSRLAHQAYAEALWRELVRRGLVPAANPPR